MVSLYSKTHLKKGQKKLTHIRESISLLFLTRTTDITDTTLPAKPDSELTQLTKPSHLKNALGAKLILPVPEATDRSVARGVLIREMVDRLRISAVSGDHVMRMLYA